MRTYETTFIINPQSDDATIEKHVSDIKDIITTTEGKIINENHMGTRRLAYEINKLTQGYYATFIYEAPTDVLPLLDHHFKVNEAFIRNLTVRIDGDPDEYMKQQDPFGKHGSDRPERGGYQRPGGPRDDKKDAPAKDAPVKEAKKEDAPKTEAKTEEAPKAETTSEEKPSEDKPKKDEA